MSDFYQVVATMGMVWGFMSLVAISFLRDRIKKLEDGQ